MTITFRFERFREPLQEPNPTYGLLDRLDECFHRFSKTQNPIALIQSSQHKLDFEDPSLREEQIVVRISHLKKSWNGSIGRYTHTFEAFGSLYKTNQEACIQIKPQAFQTLGYLAYDSEQCFTHELHSATFFAIKRVFTNEYEADAEDAINAVQKAVKNVSALARLILEYIHPDSLLGVFSDRPLRRMPAGIKK